MLAEELDEIEEQLDARIATDRLLGWAIEEIRRTAPGVYARAQAHVERGRRRRKRQGLPEPGAAARDEWRRRIADIAGRIALLQTVLQPPTATATPRR